MQNKTTKYLNKTSISVLSFIAVTLVLSNFLFTHSSKEATHSAAPADDAAAQSVPGDTGSGASKFLSVATQLQKRLSSSGGFVPGVQTLANALEKREALLKRSLTISVHDSSQATESGAVWTVSLASHPELVMLRLQWPTARYVVDEEALAQAIRDEKFEGQRMVESVDASSFVMDGKVERVQNIPIALDGYQYDADAVARSIIRAIEMGQTKLSLDVPFAKATVSVTIDGKVYALDLLASGLSNYTGSPDNRIWNVHKAIKEKTNNTLIRQGGVFSYVDAIGAPVTLSKGWVMGLGLFGGGAAMTPGAGICQAATTIYRAALLAGLPIVEKKSHSMWVDHYEPYGAGLDATVFPGVHDMRFKNDTNGPILMQAYIHESTGDVTVNLYGIADDRKVGLDGPYFWNTIPKSKKLAPLGKDQVGWIDTVTYADGKVVEKPIVSTYYKGFPRSVTQKYAGAPGIAILHAEPAPKVVATTPVQ